MRVGFIGLGTQGGPMAEMIVRAGHALHVWARRPEVAQRYASLGGVVASNPTDVAAAADVLGICVVSDADVLEVVHERGVLAAMRPGSTLLIHSTVRVSTCQAIAKAGEARGVHVLDAPVSGSGEAALARTLLVMVGGAREAFEHARPVLETYGDPVIHLGPLGAGQVAKLVNNLLIIANMNLAQAALGLGEQLGMDRGALRALLLRGSGRSFALDSLDRLVTPQTAAHVHALFAKDISLAADLAAERGVSLAPLEEQARATLAYLRRIDPTGAAAQS